MSTVFSCQVYRSHANIFLKAHFAYRADVLNSAGLKINESTLYGVIGQLSNDALRNLQRTWGGSLKLPSSSYFKRRS
jgi:hypothetical protein